MSKEERKNEREAKPRQQKQNEREQKRIIKAE